ncbi:hypothetical protein MPSEU_000330700 [Mayamaea pseudoterrestris]|nr:hypothetical protein MPSEU_000330700 [Mayamaea pseudoterrestris]
MKLYDVASLAVGFILLCLLDANAQSIFDDDVTVTPSVVPTSAPTVASTSQFPTAAPTSSATTAATAVPSASPSSSASPTTSDSSNKVAITFSYQLVTTSAFPNATVALSLVEQEFVRVLEELTTSNASGGRVAYDSFNSSKLQPCQDEFENKEQINLYDECHVVQSTVILTLLDPTQVSDAIVKYTVMERLQAFANDYNQNQTDLLVLLENPKYVSTNLNVILVAVSGVMDDEAMSFFEQLLAKAMAPYLANRNVSFKLLSTQILTQSPYDPAVNASDSVSSSNNNNNMTRHRHLQFDSSNFNASNMNNLGNVDPNTIPFNDIQMFVQATCAGRNCTKTNLEAVLHGNASSYVADLAQAINVNKQLLVSTYFDSLMDIFVARDLQVRDLPKYNAALFETDDVLQELQLDPPPSWMYVLCGVNVAIILVAVGWIVVQSLRRETREKDDLDKFSTAWDLQKQLVL